MSKRQGRHVQIQWAYDMVWLQNVSFPLSLCVHLCNNYRGCHVLVHNPEGLAARVAGVEIGSPSTSPKQARSIRKKEGSFGQIEQEHSKPTPGDQKFSRSWEKYLAIHKRVLVGTGASQGQTTSSSGRCDPKHMRARALHGTITPNPWQPRPSRVHRSASGAGVMGKWWERAFPLEPGSSLSK